MARRRKSNPEAEDLTGDVDELVAGSAAAVDLAYEEHETLNDDIQTLEQIEQRLSNEDPPRRLPAEARARLQADKKRVKLLDGLIARYTNAMVKRMNSRLDRLEASPMSALRRNEIRAIKRDVFKIENLARRKGIDLRKPIASAMGGIVTLEKEITIYAPEPKKTSSRADRTKAEMTNLLASAEKRWNQIRKHAVKHQVFFIRGAEVYHKDHGVGKVLDNDGRRLLITFDDKEQKMTRDNVVPEDVAWVDRQFSALDVKAKRGQEIVKSDIQRIIRRMKDIHNRTKQQSALRTYAESKRALTSMVGKIQTRLTGDKMDKDTVESFLHELEEFQGRIPSAARSEWSKADQRQWASDVNAVRKSLIKLRRKANPCVGFHFHGKDADELLKAIEKSNERQLKGAPKKNPTKKKVAKRRRNPALRPKEKSLLFNVARHAPYSKRLAHKKFGKETANSLLKSELIESAADAYVPGSKGFDVVNEFAPLSTREEDVWEAEVDHSAIRRALRGNPKKNPAKKKVAKKNPVPSVRIGSEFNGWKLSSKTPVTLTIKPLDIRGEVVHNLVVVDPVSGAGKNRVYALYDEAGSFTGERVVRPKTEWNSQLDTATKWANRTIGLSRSNPSAPGKKKVAKKTTRKKTPEWQLLCNRCAKLWDHYCERPSKARLKPVLDHLEKMKGSTSKKVADERKACLRVAKKEARRLKMK